MTWKEFYRQIRQGEVRSAYLFSGVEEYVKREALETLAQRLLPAGMEALNRVDLEGATASQIIDAAETLPFACQRRLGRSARLGAPGGGQGSRRGGGRGGHARLARARARELHGGVLHARRGRRPQKVDHGA